MAEQLNAAQQQAVAHVNGPLLVLAGPGSGKTFVITKRAKHLIEDCGVSPNRVLIVTFTKAAAIEMEERFNKMMGYDQTGVTFGTFHALFFKVLKYAYGYSGSNIVRDEKKLQFFREIIDELKYEIEDTKEFIEKLQTEISYVKGEGMQVEDYYAKCAPKELFIKAYHLYEDKMIKENLIDFDDMTVMCYELFKNRPDILAMWQKKYTYIEVDEVQDTNKLQYEIIRMLAKPENNLMLVGDDDQSLYRFRGAKPEILLQFDEQYPEGKRILLDINYRSDPHIIKLAGRLIKHNTKRYPKKIVSSMETENKYAVVFQEFSDVRAENEAIRLKISEWHEHGMKYKDMAVLFRTNTQPRQLAEYLMACNIPFTMKDSIPNLYEHWITRDILAYINIARGEMDRKWFLFIINRPKRYIKRESFDTPQVYWPALYEKYMDKPYVYEKLDELRMHLKVIGQATPYAAVHYIRFAVGYSDFLKEYAAYRNIKADELYDVLDELEESAKGYNSFDEWFLHMAEYKEEMMKQQQNKQHSRRTEETDAIAIMTYHGSKGLEYNTVFIPDANEKITPYKRAESEEELEEERRMFYVAFTRAKKKVYVSWVKERMGKSVEASCYISELMADVNDIHIGDKLVHRVYGEGIVKGINHSVVIIGFENQSVDRKLDLNFCLKKGILTK